MPETVRTPRYVNPRQLTPLLRWAGGKRWLARSMRSVGDLIDPSSYVEPFAGGAAVFFASAWPNAVLGDVNVALIRCYEGLASNPAQVRRKLNSLDISKATFERVGAWRPRSTSGSAARLLYLNRTAFSGIYRENASGQFNVPFAGDRSLEPILKGSRIEDAGAALAQASLVAGDFHQTLFRAPSGSLVFCDPPYSLRGGEREFRRYSRSPFNWSDQVRLADELRSLSQRGSTVVMCNSDDIAIRELYVGAQVLPITRKSYLSGRAPAELKEAIYVLHSSKSVAQRVVSVLADDLARQGLSSAQAPMLD